MAKSQYIGVDGVARKVDSGYVGVDGVARKLTKGYVGVDGVARECFSSGVTWKKYTCTKQVGDYIENNSYYLVGTRQFFADGDTKAAHFHVSYVAEDGSFDTSTIAGLRRYVGSSYYFTSSLGHCISGYDINFTNEETLASVQEKCVGQYLCKPDEYYTTDRYASAVYKIDEITNFNIRFGTTSGGVWISGYGTVLGYAYQEAPLYNKGNQELGTITVLEGELPENGTLLRGSATDSYCILQINGTYYYYEKV